VTISLLAGVSANPSGVFIAFGAGIASFVSPCVLPLVPGYLSMVSGLSVAALQTEVARKQVLSAIATFVAGFTLVFVLLGAVASSVGRTLSAHKTLLAHGSGVLLIVFGLVLLLVSLPASLWQRLGSRVAGLAISVTRERRLDVVVSRFGALTAFVLGMAFAFAWTPCIGPVLGSILALAAQANSVAGGVVLLFAYSVGLGVPFLVAGLGVERFMRFSRTYGGVFATLQILGAVVLIGFGLLLLTNHVSWLSTQFSRLLTWLHLSALATS
jgi:cytochrome c-type biogenesis protein